MSARDPQFSRIFYTRNQPDVDDGVVGEGDTYANAWAELWINRCSFHEFQLERGGEGNRLHWQGYMIFHPKRRPRLSALKKIDGKMHIEAMRGTPEQCQVYCTKDNTKVDGPWETGIRPPPSTPGKRSDLISLYESAAAGVSPLEAAAAHPAAYMRAYKAYDRIQSYLPPERRKSTVYVLFGQSGMGKTHNAFELVKEAGGTTWVMPLKFNKDNWFDGYYGQDNVVVEEFSGQMYLETLKQLLDKGVPYQSPNQVPVKGGFTWFNPRRIFITSNRNPILWYDWGHHGEENRIALLRRFDWVARFERGTPIAWNSSKDFYGLDLPGEDEYVNLHLPD